MIAVAVTLFLVMDPLGRPCRIRVEMTTDDGALVRMRVGGAVVTVSQQPA